VKGPKFRVGQAVQPKPCWGFQRCGIVERVWKEKRHFLYIVNFGETQTPGLFLRGEYSGRDLLPAPRGARAKLIGERSNPFPKAAGLLGFDEVVRRLEKNGLEVIEQRQEPPRVVMRMRKARPKRKAGVRKDG
jgi:hypothetical protein